MYDERTEEEKNHSLCIFLSKWCACIDEREKKRLSEWKRCILYTMSWAFALLYDGCFIESMPFVDPPHTETTSFTTQENPTATAYIHHTIDWTGHCTQCIHQIFYNFFFIPTHYILFGILLPGRWIGQCGTTQLLQCWSLLYTWLCCLCVNRDRSSK